ncbi:MAG: NAD-dependent epimerase/dehydratase family protein [Bacteroidia bacterium]|nr:NAD-dependent epimerase/dehydratase family protein [Bacteroidia bacterium]
MILLTGSTGFLGRHLVDELLGTGHELRVLVRNASERDLPWRAAVEVVDGDIMDIMSLEKAMEGVEAVVHAAAYVSFWKKYKDRVKEINVQGTANIVDVALEMEHPPKIVHVSSIAAIGRTKEGKSTENTAWVLADAASTYARSKREAEYQIHRGIAEGLDACMVNPGLILGPTHDWEQGTGKIFSQVYKGLPVYKKGAVGMVGVKDVARACRTLVEQDVKAGERYILVEDNWTYYEFLSEVARLLGKKAPSIRIPRAVAVLGAWFNETIGNIRGVEPGVTVESMRSSNKLDTYDGSKITTLGFEYTPIKKVLEETAKALLDSKTL